MRAVDPGWPRTTLANDPEAHPVDARAGDRLRDARRLQRATGRGMRRPGPAPAARRSAAMNPIVGWALAAVAFAVGWIGWGWQGLVLAFTVVAFWLLLQFSRSLRVLRSAGANPVGHVDSAVMLNSRLERGITLLDVVKITRSLGRKLGESPERWGWTDPGGASVVVELDGGKVRSWTLERPDEPPGDASAAR